MTPFLSLIIAALLAVGHVNGQSSKEEWTAEELHNPKEEAMKCGFPNNYPAFICDPNGILGSDLKPINWILADAAYNRTKCPCSTYYCEMHKKATGYKIGVALVKRMKMQRSLNGDMLSKSDLAQKFAYELKTFKWKLGDCEEDIIIFYSVDDKMLSIYTGSTAGKKLTPYYRDLLAYKIGPRLNDGQIVEALNVLLYDMKVVLNCDAPSTSDCTLYEKASSATSIKMSLVSFTSLATLLLVFLTYL